MENFTGTTSQFDVIWNSEKNVIEIIRGKAYSSKTFHWVYYSPSYIIYKAKPATSKILIDGVVHELKAYNIDGNNYFRLRDLADLIPFELEWSPEKK